MKSNGYVMTEALIISAVVLTALVLVYTQFSKLNIQYNNSYYFYNVNDIYALKSIASFINDDDINLSSLSNYIDITDCSMFTNKSYCNILFDAANIKNILITTRERNNLVNALKVNNPYGLRFANFANTIDDSDLEYTYMLVAAFNDSTFAAIPFNKA